MDAQGGFGLVCYLYKKLQKTFFKGDSLEINKFCCLLVRKKSLCRDFVTWCWYLFLLLGNSLAFPQWAFHAFFVEL